MKPQSNGRRINIYATIVKDKGKRYLNTNSRSNITHFFRNLGIANSSTVLAEALKTIMEESRLQLQTIINNITILKTELYKFDGNPLRYWPFIRSFENVIESKIKDNSI